MDDECSLMEFYPLLYDMKNNINIFEVNENYLANNACFSVIKPLQVMRLRITVLYDKPKINLMKKLMLTMFIGLVLTGSVNAQKVIRKVSNDVCRCLEENQHLIQTNGINQVINLCLEKAMTRYKGKLQKEYGDDFFENADSVQAYNFGLEISKQLADGCQVFKDLFINGENIETGGAAELYAQAEVYREEGNLEAALEAYTSAIALDRENPRYYNDRGTVYYHMGDAYRAIGDFMKATEINPEYGMAYYNLAFTKYNMGDLDAAMADVNEAIRLMPDYCDAQNLKGLLWYNKEEADSALQYFNRSMECDSTVTNFPYNAGYVLYLMREWEDALRYFFQAVNRGKSGEEIYSYIGNCYDQLGNLEQAVAYHTRSIEESDSSYVPYYNRSLAYYQLEKYDEALEDLRHAWSLDTTDADIVVQQTKCYEALKNLEQAEQFYSRTIEMEPGYAPYFDARALFYEKTGRHEQSIRDSEISLGIYPDDCTVHQAIGRNYRAMGEKEKADEAFARALEMGCDKEGEELEEE